MKVSEMPAGRDLDALVAEKVMGWTLCDRVAMGWGDGPPVFATGEDPYDDTARPTRQDWRPSENIAAAWEVVEKMEREGWGHWHLVHSPGAETPGCAWRFHRPGQGERGLLPDTVADTAPLAISKAALLAVGITDA